MSEEIKNKVENDESLDMVSFGIIANAGDARSFAFQALDAAKHGNFEEADELMKRSEEAGTLAHKAQTDLLFKEMNGEHTEVNVLLVHSQDHLMTSMLAQELIKELIELYKNK
ncbi:MAG: PTS lactose/cellobiose transporter subunit IIA [Erysipelotrichaceae bacterium]|nr:PTS lactose/cellobiose transporter subunit IIA [Erysipelotrichaceae bacterium]MDY6034036.1 PTS lactose/cellobiose transporter subunit IIA [Bulleidia sp.]